LHNCKLVLDERRLPTMTATKFDDSSHPIGLL